MKRLLQSVIGGVGMLVAASGSASGAQPPPWATVCPPAAWTALTCSSHTLFFCRFQRNTWCRVTKQCRTIRPC